MKSSLILLPALASIVLISCAATGPPPSLPPGAVGYWSFDEADIDGTTIRDTSGGGHDGRVERAALVTGRIGEALELEGSGDGITIDGLSLEGSQQSVCLWINRKAAGLRRLVFINGLCQVGFSGREIFVHTGRPGRADTNMPLTDLDIPVDRWTHLAVTWDTAADADHVKVYLDGQLRATGTLDAARDRPLKIETLRIGHTGEPGGINQSFAGVIDELVLYDTALPESRIRDYVNATMAATGRQAPMTPRTIVSQTSVSALPPYVPQSRYTGRKKLLRVASELVSRMLYSPSIAEADLPRRVRLWQRTGLDGLVFNLTSHHREGERALYHNMAGQWWALNPRTYDEFVPEIKAFQSVQDWGRLTDNFLWSSYAVWQDGPRMRVQNWFSDDDWKIILNNVSIQARVARECGFKGLMFDTEQYEGHHAEGAWHIPFSYLNYKEDGYAKADEAEPRPFEEVAAKIRQRGTQYARAVCAGFPGLKLLIIPGLYEWTAREGDGPLEEKHHGLYPAFIDGVLEGLDENATLIGGSELTYSQTRYIDIGNERRRFDESIEKLSGVSDALRKKTSFAAGIWVDTDRSWSDSDVTKNVRNPADHETAVRNAFKASDEYAWIYGEQSHFLGDDPTPLMLEYFRANEKAHHD